MEYAITVVDQGGSSPKSYNVDLTKPWSGIIPVATVIFNPTQPRTYFSKETLATLGASLRSGQETPITAIPYQDPAYPLVRWMLVNGERRWRATQAEGITFIWICYKPGVTQDNIHTSSFKANWCKEGHTHRDTAHAIDRELRSGKTYQQIAEMVGMTRTWAINEHKLLKLYPDLLALMDPPTPKEKRLPINVALLMTDKTHEEQLKLWEENRNKPKKEAYHHVRFTRSATITSTGKKRKPSSEKKYIRGKIETIAKDARGLVNLPEEMFAVYAGVDVSELRTYIRVSQEMLEAIDKRLVEAASKAPLQPTENKEE